MPAPLNRRDFLKFSSTAAATLAASAALAPHVYGTDAKPIRVGLIGSGWYGKCDLFRLIQVSPVEVVSLSDPDKKMVDAAAELTATRQKNGKKPRTYSDYREQVKEKDIELAIVGTPDHWHALSAIDAMHAGADLYLQKPISVDVLEGKAILDTARKLNRVVQIGTQRRSTPHLAEAKKEFCDSGRLGKIGMVEIYCYYKMRARDTAEQAPDAAPPEGFDYEMWTGPAPMRPYNKLVHPRRWRAFMEYGNGIVGDMCVHMLDMVRWMLNLGWPKSVDSTGGILVDKASRANISDTQAATFNFDGLPVIWQHRTWGDTPPGMGGDSAKPPYPRFPWGATIYGDAGTLEASVMGYTFKPAGKGDVVHKDVKFELEEYPEDKTEKDLEKHVAPAIRGHMKDLLACREQ
ncbi:MAG TPA: Gfo/Idh/MocA family oxidoreductase, partial [Tepidisphaeraceae bacterium]|nr:Gfo/Idh/MocA family oxidoreductase [Tepidisphaeraceae bacterium]